MSYRKREATKNLKSQSLHSFDWVLLGASHSHHFTRRFIFRTCRWRTDPFFFQVPSLKPLDFLTNRKKTPSLDLVSCGVKRQGAHPTIFTKTSMAAVDTTVIVAGIRILVTCFFNKDCSPRFNTRHGRGGAEKTENTKENSSSLLPMSTNKCEKLSSEFRQPNNFSAYFFATLLRCIFLVWKMQKNILLGP